MADNRSITITLKLDKSADNEADTNNQTGSTPEAKSNDKGSQGKAIAAYAAVQMLQLVASEVTAWADFYWNKELTLTDDYIAQREKNIATTHVNRVTSYVNTIGNSAMQGAMIGGTAGAVVGAIIGTVSVISNVVRSNEQGQQQQDLQIKQLDAQLSFTRSRAGWSTHAASIGEDL